MVEPSHYGVFIGTVVEATATFFKQDPTQCKMMDSTVSLTEIRLMITVLIMFANVYFGQPIVVAMIATLFKMMIEGNKVPGLKCDNPNADSEIQATSNVQAGITLTAIVSVLPAWIAVIVVLIYRARHIAAAKTTKAVAKKIRGLYVKQMWSIFSGHVKTELELVFIVCAFRLTGDVHWIVTMIGCLIKRKNDVLAVRGCTALLMVLNYPLTAMIFALATRNGKRLTAVKVITTLLIATAMIPSCNVYGPCEVEVAKPEPIWCNNRRGKRLLLGALMAILLTASLLEMMISFLRNPCLSLNSVTRACSCNLNIAKTDPKWLLWSLVLFTRIVPVQATPPGPYETIAICSIVMVLILLIILYRAALHTRKLKFLGDHNYSKPNRANIKQKGLELTVKLVEETCTCVIDHPVFVVLAILLVIATKGEAAPYHDRTIIEYVPFIQTSIYSVIMALSSSVIHTVKDGMVLLFDQMWNWSPISFLDAMTFWMCLLYAIAIVQKRMPGVNAMTVLFLTAILRWSGLDWYYWFAFWVMQVVNVFCCAMGSYPSLPGLLPMAFLMTVQPVLKYYLLQIVNDTMIIPMWYFPVFFGTLILELTPLFAKQTLVIEKDVVTGRILSQERKNGPITAILFGNVSATWDAIRQSASIGEVVEGNRFCRAYNIVKKLHLLIDNARLGMLNTKVEAVTDRRASGYITCKGQFLANCQAVLHNEMTGILANIHAIYDESGKVRNELLFHFPGQGITTPALPAVAMASHDLCILASDIPIKQAYRITNAIPAKVAVVGYNKDKTPFTTVCDQKTGLVQLDLAPGHSGCGMINLETGKLCAILWLTAPGSKTAQFIGLNPWQLLNKSELNTWATQSSLQMDKMEAKAELNDLRQKLQNARKELMQKTGKKSAGVEICNLKLKELEDSLGGKSEDQVRELALEHKLYLELASAVMNEKKSLMEKLRIYRSEREKILKEKNELSITDTSLVSELRRKAKEAQLKLNEIENAINDEVRYVPQESRMPVTMPKINWPIIYRDDTKWFVYWSKDEKQEFETTPLSNNDVLQRVQNETGLNRKAAVRFCSGHLYNKEWATSMLEKAGFEQSVFRGIIEWWFNTSRTICSYCDRKFECGENHKHTYKCDQTQVLDCERHMEYCGSNSYKGDSISIEGWNYPIIEGKVALGHGMYYTAKCHGAHAQCVTQQTPTKRYDWHKLNGKSDTQWWIRRTCVENLFKQYKETEIKMPENESLLDIIARQNRVKTVQESRAKEICKANECMEAMVASCNSEIMALKQDLQASKELVDTMSLMVTTRERDEETLKAENAILRTELERVVAENVKLSDQLEKSQLAHALLTRVLDERDNEIEKIQKKPKVSSKESSSSSENDEAEEKRKAKKQRQKERKKAKKMAAKELPIRETQSEGETNMSKSPVPVPRKNKKQVNFAEPPVMNVEPKVTQSAFPLDQRPVKRQAIGPQFPFVKIKRDVHSEWNNCECNCHHCVCKTECRCPEMMCIWCNQVDHNTEDCDHAKNGKCKCGNDRSYKGKYACCDEGNEKCIVCGGQHHSKKCMAVNHHYWTADDRQQNALFDRVFKRPDFQ